MYTGPIRTLFALMVAVYASPYCTLVVK